MDEVISKDGTRIAFQRLGAGPALILVDGAMCSRSFGPMPKLARHFARQFTVYLYDRRGRGDSTDVKPYAVAREVEDIAALIRHAGGSAFLVGLSSGAALVLEAAAAGLPVTRIALYEPPYIGTEDSTEPDHEAKLNELIRADQRGPAVKYFMRDMVRVPAFFVFLMQLLPFWPKLKKVAHTLPYDAAILGAFRVPRERAAAIRVPALVMDGEKTDPRLHRAVQETAAAIPGARHLTLPGQTHNVAPKVLAPAVSEFFLETVAEPHAGSTARAVG